MNIENLRQVAEVLIQWGFWIMVYGAVTIVIGLIILMGLDVKIIRSIGKILWE